VCGKARGFSRKTSRISHMKLGEKRVKKSAL